jgi:hypothetical protein
LFLSSPKPSVLFFPVLIWTQIEACHIFKTHFSLQMNGTEVKMLCYYWAMCHHKNLKIFSDIYYH